MLISNQLEAYFLFINKRHSNPDTYIHIYPHIQTALTQTALEISLVYPDSQSNEYEPK